MEGDREAATVNEMLHPMWNDLMLCLLRALMATVSVSFAQPSYDISVFLM